MRLGRSTLLAMGCAILAGLAAWPRTEPGPDAVAMLPRWADLRALDVQRAGVRWRVERGVDGWRVSPGGDRLDRGVEGALAEALSRPVALTAIEGAADDTYGFGPGSPRIVLHPEAGQPIELAIGKSLGARLTFVAIGSERRLARAAAALAALFDAPLGAWRDRRVLPDLDPSAVQRVEHRRGGVVDWALARETPGGPLRLVEPRALATRSAAAHAVAASLPTLLFSSLEGAEAQTTAPALRITVPNQPPLDLAWGAPVPRARARVVRVGERVGWVPEARLLFLDVGLDALREAALLPEAAQVSTVSWSAPGTTGAVGGVATRAGEGWLCGQAPCGERTTRWLEGLPAWQAAGFPAEAPPPSIPWLILTASAPEGTTTVTVGSRWQAGPARYVTSSARPFETMVLGGSEVAVLEQVLAETPPP